MKRITIWHTGDVHSRFEKFTALAGYIAKHVDKSSDLVLDSGDFADKVSVMVSGTDGLGAIRLITEAGYDAMAVGNNEFFAGMGKFKAMATEGLPLLSCNITDTNDRPIENIKPYLLLKRSGVRILLIGCCPYFTRTGFFTDLAGVKLIEPSDVIPGILEKERGNYDLCVLLSHGGELRDRNVAEKCPSVDVIIGGHSHTFMDEPKVFGKTVVFHAGCHARVLGKLDLFLDDSNKLQGCRGAYIENDLPCDERLMGILKEETQKGTQVLGKKLFTLPEELEYDAFSECAACNAVADSMYKTYGGDFAIINNGILSGSLAGDISRLKLLETAPSILNPTTVWWKGEGLREAIEKSFDRSFIEQSGFGPGFRGTVLGALSFSHNVKVIRNAKTYKTEVLINGEPLSDDRTYCVITDDYMYRGIAGYTMLHGSLQPEVYHVGYIRDLLEKTLMDDEIQRSAKIRRIVIQ